MNELGVFRSEFRDNQAVSDEIQARISLIKYELQNSIEKVMSKYKKQRKNMVRQ